MSFDQRKREQVNSLLKVALSSTIHGPINNVHELLLAAANEYRYDGPELTFSKKRTRKEATPMSVVEEIKDDDSVSSISYFPDAQPGEFQGVRCPKPNGV